MPSFRLLISLYLVCLSSISAHAEDLGIHGDTYIIGEIDGVELLKNTAKDRLNKEGQSNLIGAAQKRAVAYFNDLPPLAGIKQASESKVRYEDLTVYVNQDIKGDKGQIIVAKGTKINPLVNLPLTKKVFFIDARDPKQLQYAKKFALPKDVVILTAGSLFQSQKYLERSLYIDQNPNGVLSRRMRIQVAPSVASQSGSLLKIEEIKL